MGKRGKRGSRIPWSAHLPPAALTISTSRGLLDMAINRAKVFHCLVEPDTNTEELDENCWTACLQSAENSYTFAALSS